MPPGGESDYHGRPNSSEYCRTCTDFKTWSKLHTNMGKKTGADKVEDIILDIKIASLLKLIMQGSSRSSLVPNDYQLIPRSIDGCQDVSGKLVQDKDFKFSRSNMQSASISTLAQPPPEPRTDCPLDKDILGASTWGFLHTMAAYYPDKPTEAQKKDVSDFFSIFSRLYPCESCASHFRTLLASSPPEVKNQQSLSQWLCWVHNKVNQRLDKPLFDCSKVNERWRDGWKDGSCD